ncbi:MAG: AAA family ATPase [Candidatus Lokiarchaeota archaeon]|nr:AAA family ATPase [Candidatus Lokiarchaeota archaeon]
MNSRIISFSGKGGVGKSTLLVLFLKYLIDSKKFKNILVIDADPDANIGDLIGREINFNQTVGGKMTDLKKKILRREFPPNMPKNSIIESEIFDTLLEMDNFDLLEMGRSEGEGCYCSVNNVVKNVIDTLSQNYDITIIDSPAGLEHFSRKMSRDVEELVIITDPSKMSIHTIKRILEITNEVNLNFKNIFVIANRFPEHLKDFLSNEINKMNIKNLTLLGIVPNDNNINEINISGKNLLDLSNDNQTYQILKKIYNKLI